MIAFTLIVAIFFAFIALAQAEDLRDRPCKCCCQRSDSIDDEPYCADCPDSGRACALVSGYSLHGWRPQ